MCSTTEPKYTEDQNFTHPLGVFVLSVIQVEGSSVQDVAAQLSGSSVVTGGGSEAYRIVARDVLGVLVEKGDLSVDEFGRYHKTTVPAEHMPGWEFCVHDLEMSALYDGPSIVFRYHAGEVLAALFYLYTRTKWEVTEPDYEWVHSPVYGETMQQAFEIVARCKGE